MRQLGKIWLAACTVFTAMLFAGGGRPGANAHPAVRNGADHWY